MHDWFRARARRCFRSSSTAQTFTCKAMHLYQSLFRREQNLPADGLFDHWQRGFHDERTLRLRCPAIRSSSGTRPEPRLQHGVIQTDFRNAILPAVDEAAPCYKIILPVRRSIAEDRQIVVDFCDPPSDVSRKKQISTATGAARELNCSGCGA